MEYVLSSKVYLIKILLALTLSALSLFLYTRSLG